MGTGWCASDVQLPVSESPGNNGFDTYTTGFPPTAWRELSRLRQLRFELPRRQRHVVAGHHPPAEHHHERRWLGRRLSDVERTGLGRDRPGRTTAGAVQQPFGQLPTQCAVHIRRCRLDEERAHSKSAQHLLPGGSCYLPRLLGRPGLQWCGTRPGRQREPRSSQRDPDRSWGSTPVSSGAGGGQVLTLTTSASGYSDDKALCAFASDSVDLAYSAVGYGASGSDFSPAKCQGGVAPARPYVAIPIALNAVVLAHTPNEVQSPALQRLRDRADRLFAAQDHPRSVGPAPEQWRLRGRLGERTSDGRRAGPGAASWARACWH